MLSLAPLVSAQTLPRLPVAWAPLHPLIYEDRNGDVAGFMVDLALELGQEVGFEAEFFRVADFAAWGEAQRAGASILLFG